MSKLTDKQIIGIANSIPGVGDALPGALAIKFAHALEATANAFLNECAATGESCRFGPHGPSGTIQCQYCGASPRNVAQSPVATGTVVFSNAQCICKNLGPTTTGATMCPVHGWVETKLTNGVSQSPVAVGAPALWVHDFGGSTETIHSQRENFGEDHEWTEFRSHPAQSPAVGESAWRLVPYAMTEEMIVALMHEIHSNVPEADRPMGMLDFSTEQVTRIIRAYHAMLRVAALSQSLES